MQYPLCRHIHATGVQCGSPALLPGKHIELTAIEDRESVQYALSIVINSIATGQIGVRRRTALLDGLQSAAGSRLCNTRRLS